MSPTRTTRRLLAVLAYAVSVGDLFVPDPTRTVLERLFVVGLGVGEHALSVGGVTELAYATLACAGVALVVTTVLSVGETLTGVRGTPG